MGTVDRKEQLFENIARLRRAGCATPGNLDIAAVRVDLEVELGETVSRRLAARLLGVSHTALERWIKAGDIPVVYSAAGWTEVPVPALLDLYEEARTERNQSSPNVLAPTMERRRAAAERLVVDGCVGAGPHGRARARGLAYHRAVAQRLRKPMIEEARHVLFRWRALSKIDPHHADQWEQVLSLSLPEIRQALVDESETADDLRQNSPFAGTLSEPERRRILREIV